jgi:hypothetical protein
MPPAARSGSVRHREHATSVDLLNLILWKVVMGSGRIIHGIQSRGKVSRGGNREQA